jgi:sugar lactone lactonase YvrE
VTAWRELPFADHVLRPVLPAAGVPRAEADGVPGAEAQLGEHPAWSEVRDGLIWVDIDAGLVHHTTRAGRTTTIWASAGTVGAALPTATGELVLLASEGVLRFAADGSTCETIAAAPAAGFRFNDAALDPSGRVWAGVLPLEDASDPVGELWRLDEAGEWHAVLTGMGCPNGIAWSGDGLTMLFCESDTRRLALADYDQGTGGASNWRIAWEFAGPGDWVPDGIELAPDGHLWVAFWGLSSAVRFSPDGHAELAVHTHDPRTTSVATDPRGDLWVTTAAGLSVVRAAR